MMGDFFGTDGIRGRAGEFPLDAATVERFGYSLGLELRRRLGRAPAVVVGRDTRESGEWIEAAVTRGLHTAEAASLSAGVITTPGVAYLTRAERADAGVVISASHNPYEDNGLKVFSPSGQKLDDAAEAAIERDLKAPASDFPPVVGGMPTPDADRTAQLRAAYLSFLRDEVGRGLDLTGLKVVLDCANGAASEFAPALFESLGAHVEAINVTPNGRNINLAAGALHPEELQRKVVAARADFGAAFDGDADRAIFVNERGELADGDAALFVVATHLHERGRLEGHRAVATVMSNLGLELALKARGIALARTSVGDKYVLEELLKNGGSVGGEQSGHVIFPAISLAGDGMITAVEVLRVVREAGQSLGELTKDFVRYPQVTVNVRVARKPPLDSVPAIRAAIDALEAEMAGQGRLLVRYSGTENLARVMIEGKDEATIRRQADALAQVFKDNLS
jgi:phosphoglucosamine mutase